MQPKGRRDQQPGTFPKSIYFLPPAPSPPTPSPEKKTRVPKLLLFCSRGAAGRVGVKMPLDHPKKSAAPPSPAQQSWHSWGRAPGRPHPRLPAAFAAGRALPSPGIPASAEDNGAAASASHPGTLPAHWVPTGCPQAGSKAAPTPSAPRPLSLLILCPRLVAGAEFAEEPVLGCQRQRASPRGENSPRRFACPSCRPAAPSSVSPPDHGTVWRVPEGPVEVGRGFHGTSCPCETSAKATRRAPSPQVCILPASTHSPAPAETPWVQVLCPERCHCQVAPAMSKMLLSQFLSPIPRATTRGERELGKIAARREIEQREVERQEKRETRKVRMGKRMVGSLLEKWGDSGEQD